MSRNNQQHRQSQQPQRPAPVVQAPAPSVQPSVPELGPQERANTLLGLPFEAKEGEKSETSTESQGQHSIVGDAAIELMVKEADASAGTVKPTDEEAKIDAELQQASLEVSESLQAMLDAAPVIATVKAAERPGVVTSGEVIFHNQTLTQLMHGKVRASDTSVEIKPLVRSLEELAEVSITTMPELSAALSDLADSFAFATRAAQHALEVTKDPAVQALLRKITDL